MFTKIAARQIKCTVCKEFIFKGFPCLVTGFEDQHGPAICIHCLRLAVDTVNEKKEWPFRGWSFLTTKTYDNTTFCALCEKEIVKGDHVWISKYNIEFGELATRTEFTCIHCIEKFIKPISIEEYKDSQIKRFEKKLA